MYPENLTSKRKGTRITIGKESPQPTEHTKNNRENASLKTIIEKENKLKKHTHFRSTHQVATNATSGGDTSLTKLQEWKKKRSDFSEIEGGGQCNLLVKDFKENKKTSKKSYLGTPIHSHTNKV